MNTPQIYDVPVHVMDKSGVPAIEIRKLFMRPEDVRHIVKCAINAEPIIISLKFNNRWQSLAQLSKKGLIKYKEKNKKYVLIY